MHEEKRTLLWGENDSRKLKFMNEHIDTCHEMAKSGRNMPRTGWGTSDIATYNYKSDDNDYCNWEATIGVLGGTTERNEELLNVVIDNF